MSSTQSDDELLLMVLGHRTKASKDFSKLLDRSAQEFVEKVRTCQKNLRSLSGLWDGSEQRAWVLAYVHAALSAMCASFSNLAWGLLPASGNLVRQYFEFCGVALLIEHKIWRYPSDAEAPREIPAHKAIERLARKDVVQKLDLNIEAVKSLLGLVKTYGKHSHASPFAVAAMMDFSKLDWPLVPAFDPEKAEAYQTEAQRRIAYLDTLDSIIRQLESRWAAIA